MTPRYEVDPNGFTMAEMREGKRGRNAIRLMGSDTHTRCANPACPRWAANPDIQVWVYSKNTTCGRSCAGVVRQAKLEAAKPVLRAAPPVSESDDLLTCDNSLLGSGDHKYAAGRDLATITDSAQDRPKGFAAMPNSQGRAQTLHARIMLIFEGLRAAGVNKTGPRQILYRLKSAYPKQPDGSGIDKSDEQRVTNAISRLRQAGRLPWHWVSDSSQIVNLAGGFDNADDFEASLRNSFVKRLQTGQDVVVELYTEATATLPLITSIAHARGANVYSGSGCGGATLARDVSLRILERAYLYGQSTALAGLGDLDRAGVANVMRSHFEHVAAFLFGPNTYNEYIVAIKRTEDDPLRATHPTVTMPELMADPFNDLSVTFTHLGITPELVLAHDADCDPGDELCDSAEVRDRVRAYMNSGTDLWDRNEAILCHTIKKASDLGRAEIELEAWSPITLRQTTIDWVEAQLDMRLLARVKATAEAESFTVNMDLTLPAIGRMNGTQRRAFIAAQRRRGLAS
jgi:hypothetical protein